MQMISNTADKQRFYVQVTADRRNVGVHARSNGQLDAVLEYVESQDEHHRTRSFQEEYRNFLCKYGVEFDERYVWD